MGRGAGSARRRDCIIGPAPETEPAVTITTSMFVSASGPRGLSVTIAEANDGSYSFSEAEKSCVNWTPYGCDNAGGSTSTKSGPMSPK